MNNCNVLWAIDWLYWAKLFSCKGGERGQVGTPGGQQRIKSFKWLIYTVIIRPCRVPKNSRSSDTVVLQRTNQVKGYSVFQFPCVCVHPCSCCSGMQCQAVRCMFHAWGDQHTGDQRPCRATGCCRPGSHWPPSTQGRGPSPKHTQTAGQPGHRHPLLLLLGNRN